MRTGTTRYPLTSKRHCVCLEVVIVIMRGTEHLSEEDSSRGAPGLADHPTRTRGLVVAEATGEDQEKRLPSKLKH